VLCRKMAEKLGMVQEPCVLVNTRRAEASPDISRYVG